ncbi:MAG: DUF4382 domain-containing protein, partial [Chitinophagaceae bacterium]
NGNGNGNASTEIKVTDAPIDDASVSGVFVTIADIKVDGKSVAGFSKTTIDLNAYQKGSTKSLGTFNLEGKTYSSITFVLDFNADTGGATPGCYVLANSIKHKLEASANTFTVVKNYTITSGSSNSIVADFDLRKIVTYQSGGSDNYNFATVAEVESSIRISQSNNSGIISGTISDNVSGSAKIVAYAYKKGTYNRSVEMQGQGTSSIEFKNAITSCLVSEGNYQLHFLESGDYEIHFASYKDTNADGKFELQGTLINTTALGIDILSLRLNANATLTANVVVIGLLP